LNVTYTVTLKYSV